MSILSSIIEKFKLNIVFFLYQPIFYRFEKSDNQMKILKDIERWYSELDWQMSDSPLKNLSRLLYMKQQFRNLFFYRIKSNSNFLKMICPPDTSLTIADDCGVIEGGAIYFEHAFGSHVSLNSLSEGSVIRQLTTFGVKSRDRHNERPRIGKNVDFGANVTCIGDITIGNNAIIAAGSVVVKDVPENAIVAGNPAKVIKFREDVISN